MIEVEIKLPVQNLEEIRKKLLESGFREESLIEERDRYFDNDRGEIRAGQEALRVRETRDCLTGKTRAQMNFKGRKLDDRTMTRKELETEVEDGNVCREILQAIGYRPVEPEVIKVRRMLVKESVTACLDSVHGLGDFLELEILTDREEKREQALGHIEDILKEMGYQISDTVRTSYLSMLQSQAGI